MEEGFFRFFLYKFFDAQYALKKVKNDLKRYEKFD